jgi:DNA-directed RNA polymerase subunit E"
MSKACKSCHLIVESEAACPLCGAAEFSERYNSVVQIFDATKSEIAAKLGAKAPGRYAVKIRER